MKTDAQIDVLDFTDPNTWVDGVPFAEFDELRRAMPVSWHERETGNYWSLTRHADVAAVSRDQQNFTSTLGIYYPPAPELAALQKDMIVFQDPPSHTRLRALVSKSFTPRVVRHFDEWIRDVVRSVIADVRERDEFDYVEAVAAEVPAHVIASIMGIDPADRERFKGWATDIFAREHPGGEERFIRANLALAEYAMELREEKRRNPAEDMTTALIDAVDEGGTPLTDGEYQQFVWILLMAGFETTHTMIGHTMRLMLEDPAVDAAVRHGVEAGDLRPVVEELLRVVTPVLHFGRHATNDVEVGGKLVNAGDFVIMWYPAANHDPEVFADPYRFQPSRRPNPHMAFGGGGPHHCLGNHVARLELEILLNEIVRSGLKLKLAGEPVRGYSAFVNQLVELPVAQV